MAFAVNHPYTTHLPRLACFQEIAEGDFRHVAGIAVQIQFRFDGEATAAQFHEIAHGNTGPVIDQLFAGFDLCRINVPEQHFVADGFFVAAALLGDRRARSMSRLDAIVTQGLGVGDGIPK
jgi:hypothetical protein